MAEQKDYITYVHEVYDYLHTIPELGFEEYKTSAFILSELKKCGSGMKILFRELQEQVFL